MPGNLDVCSNNITAETFLWLKQKSRMHADIQSDQRVHSMIFAKFNSFLILREVKEKENIITCSLGLHCTHLYFNVYSSCPAHSPSAIPISVLKLQALIVHFQWKFPH